MQAPEDQPLDVVRSFKRQLLEAPEPQRKRIARLPVPAAVALGVTVLAVPAWATGLVGKVFPEDHPGDPVAHGIGTRYVLQTGLISDGRRFRLVGYNSALWRIGPTTHRPKHKRNAVCVELQLRPAPKNLVNGVIGFSCMTRSTLQDKVRLADGGTRAFGRRRVYFGVVPTHVARLHLTFRSGRHLDLRPNAPEPARLRESGLRFAFRYVAFVAPPGDRYAGMTVEDTDGRIVQRDRFPTPTPAGTPVRDSPAL
jgi:hypothetical protein